MFLIFLQGNNPHIASPSVTGFATHIAKHSSYLDDGGLVGLHTGETLADTGDHFGGRQLDGFIAWLGTAEEGVHHLFDAIELAERLIVEHELGGLFIGKPVALAILHLGEELGIELGIVDRGGGIDGTGDAHTEEAARAGGIAERLQVVGGGDEAGIAATTGDGLAIGLTELHVALRQELLELRLSAEGDSIELVDVDEGEGAEGVQQVELLGEVDVVVIVVEEFLGEHHATEGGLATSLRTDEQGHEGIAVFAVATHPMGNHRAHPQREEARPEGIVGGHAGSELGKAVAAIPLR